MGMYHNRSHVEGLRKMKRRGEKISMLYVTTPDEVVAAAGITMLSIEGWVFDAAMREAAGDCFVQVGLPYGGWGSFNGRALATAADYLHAALHYAALGGDAYYCSASYDIQKTLADNHIPVVAHIGLIPSYISWTGWRAVGKTADEALALWRHTQKLEEIGVFGAELEVVPDRVARIPRWSCWAWAPENMPTRSIFSPRMSAVMARTTSRATARCIATSGQSWTASNRNV
jgi:3-methyl-2-oxobutanoate hydroxymethyltransferase